MSIPLFARSGRSSENLVSLPPMLQGANVSARIASLMFFVGI
jgi:hypothetical protein